MKNEQIRKKLVDIWGAEGLWTPLNGEIASETLDYFELDEFQSAFGLEKLKEILEELEAGPIHEISEIQEDRIIPVSEIDEYVGIEMFYTDSDASWVIYLSHENTITIAGARLLDALKQKWANYNDFNKPWEKKS
ncbi:hypothetical protein TH61_10450 [Rufibacter sp. DG15C]|uniref:hypothetical protein n=1 Tax=Rufibacter sp. DG15C TaxID=1379909 RepID=UPI00078D308B|nr:hypothetical protein [Rufibacter sp. DG15C]AMM51508.1 hypothetical protein TH61_10450 [Rufibacter sp. DG15C]